RRVLKQDAAGCERVADAVGRGEVARLARPIARRDEALDLLDFPVRSTPLEPGFGRLFEEAECRARGEEGCGVRGLRLGTFRRERLARARIHDGKCQGRVEVVVEGRLELKR